VTEWVKGKTLDQAAALKNSEIAEELALPPVKIHCSILAEDAIKAAVDDYKKKHLGFPRTDPVGVAAKMASYPDRSRTRRHVTRYLTKRGKGVGVRLGVKTTGCSGLAYQLEYVDELAP
jgi:hypothetical protein